MIVSTRFPDLPPRPLTRANAAYRQHFAERWGRENVIFLARTRRVQTPPLPAALSIKLVTQGRAGLRVGHRSLVLEPGRCLIVNEGEPYEVDIASEVPVDCFSVHFRPGLAAEVARQRRQAWQQALDDAGATLTPTAPVFVPHLRQPGQAVLAALQRIRHEALCSQADEARFEPLFIELLAAMLDEDSGSPIGARHHADASRPALRQELARRVGWARDFILSHYDQPMTLNDMAEAASLSKYHLLRAFSRAFGQTPHQLLTSCRTQAAVRMIRDGSHSVADAALAAGFGSRWSFQRALQRHGGVSARAAAHPKARA